MSHPEKLLKKLTLAIVGISCLVLGITLVLSWWPLVVVFFKGVLGMTLAVIGLIILMLIKD